MSDYEESGEISLHLPDIDNESNILLRKWKRSRRLTSGDNELSGIYDASSEKWISKEVGNVPEIIKNTGMPTVNPLIMQKLGANPKSSEVFEEVLNRNFSSILGFLKVCIVELQHNNNWYARGARKQKPWDKPIKSLATVQHKTRWNSHQYIILLFAEKFLLLLQVL